MNEQLLEQLLNGLPQPEPSADLDARIKDTVKKSFALVSYYWADQLLTNQFEKLDEATRLQLDTSMSGLRNQYGKGFHAAYSDFVAKQNATQFCVAPDEPDLGLE